MQISTSLLSSTAILRLHGRFDFSSHREFRDAIKTVIGNPAVKNIQIEFGSVEYLDSSALGMLLLSREQASAVGKTIALCGAAGNVKQVLDIANVHKLFPFS